MTDCDPVEMFYSAGSIFMLILKSDVSGSNAAQS